MLPIGMKKVSIILPVYNEEKNLPSLLLDLNRAISKLRYRVQVVFVDDASRDNTFKILDEKSKSLKSEVVLIQLRTNSGQSSAINAGIKSSNGDYILTMDSDGQHDPSDIVRLVNTMGKGNDMVCGWRTNRYKSDSFFFKHIPSRISNFLINKLMDIKLKDVTGGMRIFTKEVVDYIYLYENMNRFIPIIAVWKGFKVGEIPIKIRKRRHGKTNYNIFRLYGGFLDLLTLKFLVSFSHKPLHFFGGLSLIFLIPGLSVLLYLAFINVSYGISVLDHLFLFFTSAILVIMSFIFLSFGVIADMVSLSKIYEFGRPTFVKKIVKKKR
jgi:glycosyltransferase involved in cell wall biosynthesis